MPQALQDIFSERIDTGEDGSHFDMAITTSKGGKGEKALSWQDSTSGGALVKPPKYGVGMHPGRAIYKCPKCGGKAHNGPPSDPMTAYRGGGECADCGEKFSIVGMKIKPERDAVKDDFQTKGCACHNTCDKCSTQHKGYGVPSEIIGRFRLLLDTLWQYGLHVPSLSDNQIEALIAGLISNSYHVGRKSLPVWPTGELEQVVGMLAMRAAENRERGASPVDALDQAIDQVVESYHPRRKSLIDIRAKYYVSKAKPDKIGNVWVSGAKIQYIDESTDPPKWVTIDTVVDTPNKIAEAIQAARSQHPGKTIWVNSQTSGRFIPGPTGYKSYFAVCPRDSEGHCKPKGTSDETGVHPSPFTARAIARKTRGAWNENDQKTLDDIKQFVHQAGSNRGDFGLKGLQELAKHLGIKGISDFKKAGLAIEIKEHIAALSKTAPQANLSQRLDRLKLAEQWTGIRYLDRVVNGILALSHEGQTPRFKEALGDVAHNGSHAKQDNIAYLRTIRSNIERGLREESTPSATLDYVLGGVAENGNGDLSQAEFYDWLLGRKPAEAVSEEVLPDNIRLAKGMETKAMAIPVMLSIEDGRNKVTAKLIQNPTGSRKEIWKREYDSGKYAPPGENPNDYDNLDWERMCNRNARDQARKDANAWAEQNGFFVATF